MVEALGIKPVIGITPSGPQLRLDIDATPVCKFLGNCVSQSFSFMCRHKISTALVGTSLAAFFFYKMYAKQPAPPVEEPVYTSRENWVNGAPDTRTQDAREGVRVALAKNEPLIYSCRPILIFPPKIASNEATLIKIRLSCNKIDTIPPEIGQLQKLEILDLSGNLISEIPNEIASLLNLKELDLSENHLERLPAVLAFLSNLKVLKLSGNPFKGTFPEAIFTAEWKNLETLELGDWLKLVKENKELVTQMKDKATAGSNFAKLFCDNNKLPY